MSPRSLSSDKHDAVWERAEGTGQLFEQDAEPRRERPDFQVGAILIFFIFVGPLAGLAGFVSLLLGFSVFGLLAGADHVTTQNLMNLLVLAVVGIPFAYMYGFIPAAAAGLAVGLLRPCMTRVPWYLALFIGLCIGAAFTIVNQHDMILGWPGETGRWGDHLLNVFPCVFATMVCWAVVRNWFMPRRAPQDASFDEAKTL